MNHETKKFGHFMQKNEFIYLKEQFKGMIAGSGRDFSDSFLFGGYKPHLENYQLTLTTIVRFSTFANKKRSDLIDSSVRSMHFLNIISFAVFYPHRMV